MLGTYTKRTRREAEAYASIAMAKGNRGQTTINPSNKTFTDNNHFKQALPNKSTTYCDRASHGTSRCITVPRGGYKVGDRFQTHAAEDPYLPPELRWIRYTDPQNNAYLQRSKKTHVTFTTNFDISA